VWVLPTGHLMTMNSQSQGVQVIVPATGQVLTSAPALPPPLNTLSWEYPSCGNPVMLKSPVINPNAAVAMDFIIFGGTFLPRGDLALAASSYSARIQLRISAGGDYSWSDWEVESMPGPRFLMNSLVLPNGWVVLLDGAEVESRLLHKYYASVLLSLGTDLAYRVLTLK
jgi:hypothetical protein